MVVNCNELEFPNICSTLIDKKVHLGEKINLLKQVKKTENDYDQIIIDWICSTIEYVSNNNKYITLNSADINELLILLNSKLKTNVFSTTREVILNPNIFEVLTRFFNVSSSIINCESLLNTWYLLLQNESWKENLTIKSNIVSLGWYCEFYIGNQGVFDDEVILSVIENLLECYLYYIKSQYVSKKVFSVFCNQLLTKLMCMRAVCFEFGDKYENIISCIDKLFTLAICSKEHLINLKLMLKSNSSAETPTKKRKLDDDTCVSKKTDTLREKKGKIPGDKLSKDDVYFHLFFYELLEAKPDVSDYLLKALPRIYETIISSARSSESSLTHLEEFYLLMNLSKCLKLGLNLIAMTTLGELLDVVIKYDIYQCAEDKAIGNTFHKWMADFTQMFINGCENSDDGNALKHLCLKIILKILNINHLVLQPILPKIWNMCLQHQKDESPDLQKIKESFLCELLATYENLHQLDSLFSSFGITELEKDTVIIYPQTFHERFQRSISNLLTVQINGILDIYLSKLKDVCTSINENRSETTVCRIEHETYMLCYLVLMNASVIPANGYRKPELELLIKKLRMLKVAANEFVDTVLHHPGSWESEINHMHVQALVQHGVNNIFLLLKEFSLIDDEDDDLAVFDISNIYDDAGANNPVKKYLKAALCFDQLNNDEVTEDVVTMIKKIYKDACDDVADGMERWNGQVFCISLLNCNDALVKLFEENLSTAIAFDNKILISLGLDLVWKVMLQCDKQKKAENEERCSYILHSLPSYNSIHFQVSLLTSIHHSFAELITDGQVDVDLLLREEVNVDAIIEVKNNFSVADDSIADKVQGIQLSEIDEQLCMSILKVIQKLPLVYFTEQNLFTLSIMVLRVWEKLKTSNYVQINYSCLQIVGNILEIYAVGSHTSCHLPLRYIFNSNLLYAAQNQMTPDFEGNLISSCISAIKAIVKYVSKDDGVTSDICKKLLFYLAEEEISKPIIVITEKMLVVLSKMLSEPTIKSRSEHTAYQVVSTLSESLVKLVSQLHDGKHEADALFSIFANLCKITQHAQVRKKESSPLKLLEDKLVDVFPVVSKSINTLLETGTESNENKHLQVIEFFYSSSHELTLRLRKLLQQPETDIVSILMKNAESNSSTIEAYGHLISNIVLRVDQDMLVKLLDALTEKLVFQLKRPDKKSVLKVWYMLLTSKWEKEQRITLWDYLPKVMLACVHMTKVMENVGEIKLLLRLLTSAVNIGKNSLMSQYVNVIFHVFVVLPEKVKEAKYNSFADLFEEIYQLASQLLFHHQSAIFSSLHAYISSVNSVLEILISYITSNIVEPEDSQKCCERMARLYREIGSHKGIISKYSSFIISRFIRTSLSSSLSTSNKKLLESGIYCIMDTCTETEFSFLNTTLEKADKEYFKIIKNNYEKHHKFTGKA